MTDPRTYRPQRSDIPTNPGVYRFRDEHGRVIYVGKAKNLRNRVWSYFAPLHQLSPKTRAMVTSAAAVQWTVVGSEFESLQLEYTWIKEFTPRFNIAYRDDKSYPYLSVTMSEDVPRVLVTRGEKKPGNRYFGPYSQAWAIRETLDALLRVFPVRTCSKGVFQRAVRSDRPCLLAHIDKCAAPCVGRISEEDHRVLAEDLCRFMAGHAKPYIRELKRQMQEASENMDFETAAARRDDVAALEKVFERNTVVLPDSTDADFFAIAEDELEAAVQVFHVRGGRIRGQRGWVTEKVEEVSTSQLIEDLLQQVYGEAQTQLDPEAQRRARRRRRTGSEDVTGNHRRTAELAYRKDVIPRTVYVSTAPEDLDQIQHWLSEVRGSRVEVLIPQRGEKAQLLDTVAENARQALALHKSRRAGDLTTRSASLQQLQEALELPDALMRIECYDISHVQGTNVVASMVVFEDGLARKGEYRKFAITGDAARDDTASMYDVIYRRFSRHLEQQRKAQERDIVTGEVDAHSVEEEPTRAFAYPPNLVIVDGGPPQVAAAQRALDDLGITDVFVVGLAKRLEEVWLPDDEFPVILPRASEGLYLLQRVRDEAHRFAITFHRQKRSKSMTASVLDDVAGLGPAKHKALLSHFGSVAKVKAASLAEIEQVKGFGSALALRVAAAVGNPEALQLQESQLTGGESTPGQDDELSSESMPAVDMATGELL